MRRALSVRWRLTLVYAGTAVLTSAVLLAVIYVLVREGRGVPWSSVTVGELPSGSDPLILNSPHGMSSGTLVATVSAQAVDHTLAHLLWWSGAGLLLMALVSIGVGWLFAGRMLAPVHTITSRAREISAASLDERVSLGGPHDELRELADTFDSMLDRMQDAFESERRLVATMSHELRTPLANQRAALDVALADPDASAASLRAAAEAALGQTERANSTIEALLTLARVQSGVEALPDVAVDLAALVNSACDDARSAADGLSWSIDLHPVTVQGSPDLVARALANLFGNAVVHNVADGWVDVRLRATGDGARLTVATSGAVIPPDRLGGLTLPFRRGHQDRINSHRGVGLGLSIVKAIVDHHGGTLELHAPAAGGLVVELTLPSS